MSEISTVAAPEELRAAASLWWLTVVIGILSVLAGVRVLGSVARVAEPPRSTRLAEPA